MSAMLNEQMTEEKEEKNVVVALPLFVFIVEIRVAQVFSVVSIGLNKTKKKHFVFN